MEPTFRQNFVFIPQIDARLWSRVSTLPIKHSGIPVTLRHCGNSPSKLWAIKLSQQVIFNSISRESKPTKANSARTGLPSTRKLLPHARVWPLFRCLFALHDSTLPSLRCGAVPTVTSQLISSSCRRPPVVYDLNHVIAFKDLPRTNE